MHTCDVATLFADIADDSALRALRPPAPPTTSAGSDFSLPGDAPTYAPDRPADVRHMDIDVRLDFATQSITGDVVTWFSVLFEEIGTVALDAAELEITEVTLVGKSKHDAPDKHSKQVKHETPLTFWQEGEKLRIRLDRPYHYGEEFGVRVRYHATPRAGLTFVAPTKGDPNLAPQAWTQGETEYHHYWLPTHDFPNDRATTTMRATVPANMITVSNGKLEETIENDDGTKTYCWRQDVAFPAYLITLVVGEFTELRDTAKSGAREVPLTYNVRPGREEDAQAMMGKTPGMIAYYTEQFGVEYPYAKYAQTVAETFLGAMENVSATTHTYRLLADKRGRLDWKAEPVVAHELVHQWFGDLLAVRDWSHTWLKESFATYFEADWMRHEYGEDDFREELRGNLSAYLEADAHGRRPIVYNVYHKNAEELFDCHNYQKGSLVLHMLRYVVGEAPFWRGIQRYAQRNQGREVITADLERAMEEATGRSLARFFEQWLYKAGHPEFNVNYAWDSEQRLAKLTVRQTQEVNEQTPLFATPVDIAFFVPESDTASPDEPDAPMEVVVRRVMIDQAEQTLYFPLERRPFGVRFDYGGWLIKTLDFERSADLLRYQLRRDPDIRGRIEAAEALGKLADRQSVAALESALLAEKHWAARAAIARALGGQRTERALTALINALDQLDPEREPKARLAIVEALGEFQAQGSEAQATLAERAAAALSAILEHGDPSYRVFAAAARSLGKTRASRAFEQLTALTETPSWTEIIRNGVFAGMGALGDPRVIPILTDWTTNMEKPMDARAAAARGLLALANTKRIDAPSDRTRAVEALIAALDDPWIWTLSGAIPALGAWGDARAIPALERLIASHPDERVVRGARLAIRQIRKSDASAETQRLRDDIETLRDEHRRLRDRVEALEVDRNGQGRNGAHAMNGSGGANGANGANGMVSTPTRKRRAHATHAGDTAKS